jgi:hypothetical protein
MLHSQTDTGPIHSVHYVHKPQSGATQAHTPSGRLTHNVGTPSLYNNFEISNQHLVDSYPSHGSCHSPHPYSVSTSGSMVSTCPCPSSIVPQDGVHPGKLYPNPPHAHAHAQSPHLQYSAPLLYRGSFSYSANQEAVGSAAFSSRSHSGPSLQAYYGQPANFIKGHPNFPAHLHNSFSTPSAHEKFCPAGPPSQFGKPDEVCHQKSPLYKRVDPCDSERVDENRKTFVYQFQRDTKNPTLPPSKSSVYELKRQEQLLKLRAYDLQMRIRALHDELAYMKQMRHTHPPRIVIKAPPFPSWLWSLVTFYLNGSLVHAAGYKLNGPPSPWHLLNLRFNSSSHDSLVKDFARREKQPSFSDTPSSQKGLYFFRSRYRLADSQYDLRESDSQEKETPPPCGQPTNQHAYSSIPSPPAQWTTEEAAGGTNNRAEETSAQGSVRVDESTQQAESAPTDTPLSCAEQRQNGEEQPSRCIGQCLPPPAHREDTRHVSTTPIEKKDCVEVADINEVSDPESDDETLVINDHEESESE